MAAGQPVVPNIPMQPGQGQGPGGFPVGQPGFLSPPIPKPTPIINPELAPPEPDALEIDPLALHRDVKITVKASERMRTRDGLKQAVPYLAQFIMSGPFLQELAQADMGVDFVEFARMQMDAVGLQEDYRIFVPLTDEQKQKRSQPSPDAQLKAQQAQQEAQTRIQIMDKKVQSDQQIAQINAMVKNKEISEESARHILQIMQQEQSDMANKPDPREKMMELQMKAQEHGMNLQHQQQKHQMDMIQAAQKHKLETAKAVQSHQLSIQQQHQQNQADAQTAHTKMVFDHLASKQKLRHTEEAHKKKVSLMKSQPTSKGKK